MKKIIKIFPIFMIIIMFILTTLYTDFNNKTKYTSYDGYFLTGLHLDVDNKAINSEMIKDIINIANKHNVILVKDSYNKDTDSRSIYTSLPTLEKIRSIMDVSYNKINDVDEYSFIATYDTKKDRQAYRIKDFLNNDKFEFYTANSIFENSIYYYDDYSLFYMNEHDLNSFYTEVSNMLDLPVSDLALPNWGQLSTHSDLVMYGLLGCSAFAIVFFFIINLFLLYRESKKIGCLQLLGFTDFDITKQILGKNVIYLSVAGFFMLLLSTICIPNINIEFISYLLMEVVFSILAVVLITYVGERLIAKNVKTSNIIKKESIVARIGNICLFTKFIAVALLIMFVINMLPGLLELVHSTKSLSVESDVMDYAVFARFNVENEDFDNNEKYLNLYKGISEAGIESMYVDFREYLIKDGDEVSAAEKDETEGASYRLASVDKNYLKKYKVKVFDSRGKEIDFNNIQQEFVIIPLSKEKMTKNFLKDFKTRREDLYKEINLSTDIPIYYYEDQKFTTFDTEKGIPFVEAPIIRVIDENYPLTYTKTRIGLDIAGTGMSTALKINILDGKKNVYQKLHAVIKSAGLEKVFDEDKFVAYSDYYGDKVIALKNTSIVFTIGLAVIFLIYIIIVFQTFILFIESRMSEVLVKTTMGFKRIDIFKEIIMWNFSISIIPILGVIIQQILNRDGNLLLNVGICLIFSIVDILVLLMIINMLKMNNVYTKLKGE